MNLIEKYTDFWYEAYTIRLFDLIDRYPAFGIITMIVTIPMWWIIAIGILVILPVQFVLDLISLLLEKDN